ncbi:MAG TPA: hypothetical protein VKF63_13075 [Terracidiphilus sp.]|nr:hypothetical protein [Terracidiphilus sp.]
MPVDFGEIAAYHHYEAARHYALAQAALDRGCPADAEFQAGQAARWEEAAREQKIGMMQQPARPSAKRRPNFPPPAPPIPLAVVWLLAVVRAVKRIAAAFGPAVVKQSAPSDDSSLR